ncbi:MAG: zinc-ribbon domain-containing protein [Terriglobales bacterium]
MFCDSCGTPIQPGQAFCVRCGKPIVGTPQLGSSRVARHAQMLGILWIAYSAMLVLASFFMVAFFQHVLPVILRYQPPVQPNNGPPPEVVFGFIRPIMHFLAILIFVKAVAGIVAGIGLLQRAEWSRMLAIVLACISLISMPFGTALGVYSLWVLLSPNADSEFRSHGRAVAV